nr:YbeF family protein [Bacillus pumilus]
MVGYINFKRVYIVLMITFAASTIFIFAYTGFDMSNMHWVIAITFLCMCTSVITKIIHYMIRRYKNE